MPIPSPSKKKTLFAWLRIDANMAITGLSLYDNVITLQRRDNCIEYQINSKEMQINSGITKYSPDKTEFDVTLNSRNGICTIENVNYFVLKSKTDELGTLYSKPESLDKGGRH